MGTHTRVARILTSVKSKLQQWVNASGHSAHGHSGIVSSLGSVNCDNLVVPTLGGSR